MLLGRWAEPEALASQMLARPNISPVNKLNPLIALGTIRARRGEPGRAGAARRGGRASRRASPSRSGSCWRGGARAEHWWLSDRDDLALEDVLAIYPVALGRVCPWVLGSLAVWLHRLGSRCEAPRWTSPEPYALEIAGDWRGAAAAWGRAGRAYDAALVELISLDEEALREALVTFDELGARRPRPSPAPAFGRSA